MTTATLTQRAPVATCSDGSAVCRHRDLSVCPECATHPAYVGVVGMYWWVPDPSERAQLLSELVSADLSRWDDDGGR